MDMENVKLIQVIETVSVKGSGSPGDPVRLMKQYWSLDGKKLAETDPYLGEISKAASKASSDVNEKISFLRNGGDFVQLALIRKARNLTQAELARRIGVDQTAIHMWETGKTTPRLPHLKLLAKELDCSLDDLVSPASDDQGA